eukprot:CAMPEP_0204466836 /NCGR_PEP_ID=MMETSP0471-20130131/9394_1 /ASSEMBLY_ACC=CAM_ASM_000602 /TAXON_ID=2969 /ORGANISM="Oxyrrhis marina" /LENGTH=46 /DNA_ID= /DNA_START= /DNA_END= /DNA_ORIENTATION=
MGSESVPGTASATSTSRADGLGLSPLSRRLFETRNQTLAAAGRGGR